MSITAQDLAADTNGAAVDLQGCDSALVLFEVGNGSSTLSTTNYMRLDVQESDDGSSGWTNVPREHLYPQPANNGIIDTINAPAEDTKVVKVAYLGNKRYIQARVDETGTVTGFPVAACVIRGHLANTMDASSE